MFATAAGAAIVSDSQTPKASFPPPHPDALARRVGDEMVLVQLGENEVYALNLTGARLWELIDQGCSRSDAVDQIVGEFDVSREQVEVEVDALLELLLRANLLSSEPE